MRAMRAMQQWVVRVEGMGEPINPVPFDAENLDKEGDDDEGPAPCPAPHTHAALRTSSHSPLRPPSAHSEPPRGIHASQSWCWCSLVVRRRAMACNHDHGVGVWRSRRPTKMHAFNIKTGMAKAQAVYDAAEDG